MHVSYFSGSFLTIIDFILGKIQITPLQRFFYLSKKIINTYTRVKNMYTKCTNNDQNIVNDQQQ